MGRIDCKSLSYKTPMWQGEYSCTFGTGEWHVLCGGSGAGKSTLLHLMLGLTEPTSGDIVQDGVSLAALPPHKRQMSFMSQLNALFPGITVEDNLMLALHDSSFDIEAKKKKIGEMADHLRIRSELLERLPSKLSGGELSRCNLARALLRPCRWLLLDEPFAAVDRPTRLSILGWLREWQKNSGSGVILVSHDLDDVFTVASHVTVVENGKVIENTPISTSINRPSHTATAQLLRAGIVLQNVHGHCFVSARNIQLSRSQVPCPDEFIQSVVLQNPQVTEVGGILRIIDLATASDLSLPANGTFQGSLWFDQREMLALRDS